MTLRGLVDEQVVAPRALRRQNLRPQDGRVRSDITPVAGEARVAEVARMLGGERLSGTSLAHAQEMLSVGATASPARKGRKA